jgi:hypothetical protein
MAGTTTANSSITTLVGSQSKCATITDAAAKKTCEDDENKAAAAAATAAAAKKKPVGTIKVYPKSSSGNLECTMDGFNDMFSKLIENLFIALALVKETFAYLIPKDLSLAVSYAWEGAIGLGSWIGYAFSALYFVGLDFGFGQVLCDVGGYGYYAIDGLN